MSGFKTFSSAGALAFFALLTGVHAHEGRKCARRLQALAANANDKIEWTEFYLELIKDLDLGRLIQMNESGDIFSIPNTDTKLSATAEGLEILRKHLFASEHASREKAWGDLKHALQSKIDGLLISKAVQDSQTTDSRILPPELEILASRPAGADSVGYRDVVNLPGNSEELDYFSFKEGKKMFSLSTHFRPIKISDSGKYLVGMHNHKPNIYILLASTGEVVHILPKDLFNLDESDQILSICVSDTGERILFHTSSNEVVLFDIKSEKIRIRTQLQEDVKSVDIQISPDGNAAIIRQQNKVSLFVEGRGSTFKKFLIIKDLDYDPVFYFSGDSKTFYYASSYYSKIRFWDLAQGAKGKPLVFDFPEENSFVYFAQSPNAEYFIAAGVKKASIYHMDKSHIEIEDLDHEFGDVIFSSDSQLFAATVENPNDKIRIFNREGRHLEDLIIPKKFRLEQLYIVEKEYVGFLARDLHWSQLHLMKWHLKERLP